MRILWVSWKDITHPDAGGAEIVGVEHAKAWVKAGHSVHWVSTGYIHSKKYIEKDGITYEHIGKKWFVYTGIFHILIFVKYITQWKDKYDFVIDEYHGVPTGMPLYVRKPMIAIIHEVAGDIWKKMFKFPINYFGQYIAEPLMLSVYKNTQMITVSDSTKRDLINHGLLENKIAVIPNGIMFSPRSTVPAKESLFTLIYVSELRPMKGVDRVYSAYKIIKEKIPEVRLWVIGNDHTEYARAIKEKVTSDGMDSSITFWGKVSEREKIEKLTKAHVLVHGSYKEGWSLVVIEANANATIAIAFNAAGLRDSIRQGETGYLVESESEFADRVFEVYENNELYNAMQLQALDWSKKFTWDKSTESSLQLIESTSKSWKY